MEWSAVLPVKDELNYLHYSLPSIAKLHPSEIVLCLDYGKRYDYPLKPEDESFNNRLQEIEDFAAKVCQEHKVSLVVSYIKPNPKWKFHQGWVRRVGYLTAEYDKIFTFDVDCVLYPDNIMVGYDLIGKDNVAFVTFRKKLVYLGFVNSLRSTLYEIRRLFPRKKLSVNKEKLPFIGIYWLYRPFYLDLVREEIVSEIFNGEDTLASFLVTSQSKYSHIHLDDVVACWSLREGNEDLPWRQEQLGIYLGCLSRRKSNLTSQIFSFYRFMLMFLWKFYPGVVKGYFMGRKYPEDLSKKIRSLSFDQMIMYSKLVNGRWLFDYPE